MCIRDRLVALRFERAQAVLGDLQLMCGETDRLFRFGNFALQNAAVVDPQADVRALLALSLIHIFSGTRAALRFVKIALS